MERQKVQVHILPTENASNILINKESTLVITNNSYTSSNPQHLYFTSDEKIEEGDWCIVNGGLGRIGVDRYQVNVKYSIKPLKIVATTDKSLHLKPKLRVGSILTSEKLPQIPQSFIKQYVEAGGFDEVEVECEKEYQVEDFHTREKRWVKYSEYSPEEYTTINSTYFLKQDKLRRVIKVDSNNCAIVHSIKDSWNREEVIKILKKFEKYLDEYPSAKTSFVRMDNWIEKNL